MSSGGSQKVRAGRGITCELAEPLHAANRVGDDTASDSCHRLSQHLFTSKELYSVESDTELPLRLHLTINFIINKTADYFLPQMPTKYQKIVKMAISQTVHNLKIICFILQKDKEKKEIHKN